MTWWGQVKEKSRPAVRESRMTYREYEEVLKVVGKCARSYDRTPIDPIEEMLDRWTALGEK